MKVYCVFEEAHGAWGSVIPVLISIHKDKETALAKKMDLARPKGCEHKGMDLINVCWHIHNEVIVEEWEIEE